MDITKPIVHYFFFPFGVCAHVLGSRWLPT